MNPVTGRAQARIGLLGNPSDGYGGRVIAFTIRDFTASVTLEEAGRFEVAGVAAASLEELIGRPEALDGAAALLVATLRRFLLHFEGMELPPLHMRVESDIPFQCGLAGSSAIVIAALRALARRFEVRIPPDALAELALAAEVEELGISSGPQDRVIQAHEGLMFMDFGPGAGPPVRLDPALLPPLFVAWRSDGGPSSSLVHDEIRGRFERGDAEVHAAMLRFARLADEGLRCLRDGNAERLGALLDESFDTRASIWPLSGTDRELVAIGRGSGAAVKLCGSGGAVVGLLRNPEDYPAVRRAYLARGHAIRRPRLSQPSDEAGSP
ncbi:MAG: mevalonate kinase [Planctomycetota bacterium]